MSALGLFVTGTDTGVGKTVTAVALLRALVQAKRRAIGMKPVAAGIEPHAKCNADVLALAAAGNVDAPLRDRSPYAFAQPIAPHLAAKAAGVAVDLAVIAGAFERLAKRSDAVIVEGAGGALVPLGDRFDMLDIARTLALPALLVVGIRLGCLNHALLSALALRERGVALRGWVAARIDPAMPCADENVEWLARRLDAPLVADLHSSDAAPLPHRALSALQLA